jgi:anaphase-promoting complex subunit 10
VRLETFSKNGTGRFSVPEINILPVAMDSNPHVPLATRQTTTPRLSLGMDSDESSSEPDLSVLGMTRPGPHRVAPLSYDYAQVRDEGAPGQAVEEEEPEDEEDSYEDVNESMYQGHSGIDDIGVEEQVDTEEEEQEETTPMIDPATAGLKEISNLGRFTVSSHKPGCGVEQLRSDDLKSFWQSDGPQPHKLTIYFVKRVGIRDIRFYVDYTDDESYTPTKIVFRSGTSENNLIEFATMTLDSPVGWQQVPVAGAGGDPDGNTLVSYVLQMQILENHQNGKDTHLRGIKIYAFDADTAQGVSQRDAAAEEASDIPDLVAARSVQGPSSRANNLARLLAATRLESGEGGLSIPDFMREPEIR